MAKKQRVSAQAKVGRGSSDQHTAWRSTWLGVLILASSITSCLPPFAEGATDRTRAAAVLVVATGWLVAWALGHVRFSAVQRWWIAGLGAVCASLLASSLLVRFPTSELLGGLGTGMGAVQWLALAVVAAGASSVLIGRSTRLWISLAFGWVVPIALFGLWQAATGQAVTGGMLNRDLFGLVLLVWFGPAVGLAATSRHLWARWAWLGAAGVLGGAVFASGARAASAGIVLELGLCMALIAPVWLPAAHKALLWVGGAIAAGSALAVSSTIVVVASGGSLAGRLEDAFGPTLQTRALLYQGALRAFVEHPVVGAGVDGYQLAAQRFTQPALMAIEHGAALVDTTAADPHSIVVRLLVSMGLVGLIAVGFAAAGWVLAIARASAPTPKARALRDSLAIGAGGFALAALASPWPLTIGASPALVVGLAAAQLSAGKELPEAPKVARWIVTALVGGVFLFVAWSGAANYASFIAAVNSPSPQDRVVALQNARAATPWDATARFQALWSQGSIVEQGTGDVGAFQRAADSDPLVTAYAPLLLEFVRQSLANAQLSGRRDLVWERARLETASQMAPGIPEVSAERLHLALVSGDRAAVASALAVADESGGADVHYSEYAAQAHALLGQ